MKDQRFHSLDAMRGFAAIAVVILHIGDVMHLQTVHYAYLAVDFFFVLSGFVLARAESRLRSSLSSLRFLEMRVIRLYPLFALGIIFGAINVIGQIVAHSPTALSPASAVGAFAMNALMLPAVNSRTSIFPLNGPAWSLFFEMVINIAFAFFLYRLKSLPLAILCAVVGALYLFGILRVGHADVGMYWSNIGLGLLRVGFSFPLGVLLARAYNKTTKVPSPLSLVPIVMLAVMMAVVLPPRFDRLYDVIAIFVAMPMLMWLGAIYELPKRLEKIGALLGDISYPLYAIHFPLLQTLSYIFVRKLHLPGPLFAAAFVPGVIWLAWFLSHHFDVPVRRWLSARSKLRATAMPPALP